MLRLGKEKKGGREEGGCSSVFNQTRGPKGRFRYVSSSLSSFPVLTLCCGESAVES